MCKNLTIVHPYKISSRNLKKAEFCRFECPKRSFFDIYDDFGIYRFSIFVRFGPFIKCSWVIICVLDENQKYISHHQNSRF